MNRDEIIARVEDVVTPAIHVGADLNVLQRRFAELMERINLDLEQTGFSQDDYVLDRSARMRYIDSQRPLEVPVESISDHKRLLKPFHERYLAKFGSVDQPRTVVIDRVRICAIRAPDFPTSAPRARSR